MPDIPPLSPGLLLTDAANSRRLWELAGADLRWVEDMGGWAAYDGRRWEMAPQAPARIARAVAEICAGEVDRAEDPTAKKAIAAHAKRAASRAGIQAMIELLKSEPGIEASASQFDADAMALNTEVGTVDLRTGRMRAHRREDLMMRMAPAPSSEICPLWEEWLKDVFQGAEMAGFAQRALGYSITGSVEEQCLFFLPGPGSNGKSTLFRILQQCLGDYAGQTPRTLLMADEGRGDRHPTELTAVRGLRLAHSSESPEDARLDETKMKALTGGDCITARYMHGNFFSFQPSHKLWLGTNHLPRIHGTEHAVWRRIRVLPMPVQFWRAGDPERPPMGRLIDPGIERALLAEAPSVLGWLIRGAAAWWQARQAGEASLASPLAVEAATRAYRLEQDRLEQWIDERCLVGEGQRHSSPGLYADYQEWCQAMGERAESLRTWSRRVSAAGFGAEKANSTRYRTGLRLATTQEQAAGWTGRRQA